MGYVLDDEVIEGLKEIEKDVDLLKELISTQREYIALLGKALDESIGFLYAHGWKAKEEDVKLGEKLRKRIAEIEDGINKL